MRKLYRTMSENVLPVAAIPAACIGIYERNKAVATSGWLCRNDHQSPGTKPKSTSTANKPNNQHQ